MISLIGYAASVLLGISLLVNNDLKFRWINTFGCFTFIIYGVFINAYPIIITNAALLLINIFYLFKIYRTEEAFDIAAYQSGDNIINRFLEFYKNDIRLYFPHYLPSEKENYLRFVVLRDMVIANIFEASLQADGTALVHINYTVPKYRDYKVGKFIFNNEKKYLTNKGVTHIVYDRVDNKNHEQFLETMGFTCNTQKQMIKSML